MDKFQSNKSFVKEDKFLNALAEAYRLQEAIISATELAIVSTAPNGIITSFNRAAEQLLGYEADAMIGKASITIFHDLNELIQRSEQLTLELGTTVAPNFDTLIATVKQNQVADRREWTYVRKDGTGFPVIVSLTALADEQGKLLGYAAIATDISVQRRDERIIQDSEANLQALVTALDEAVFVIDADGVYLNVWARNSKNLPLPSSEMIGKSIASIFGEEVDKPFKDMRQKVLTTGEPQTLEYKSPMANDPRWFVVKYSLIRNKKGDSMNRISASVRDITDRKLTEFSLRESEQKFRLLAENIPGVVYLCSNDENYSMLFLNDKVEEVTGYSKDDFLRGKVHFPMLYAPDDAETITQIVDRALASRTSFELMYRIKHKSGEWRWIEEHGIGVYFEDQLIMIEGYLSDVTSKKLAEDKLRQMSDEHSRVFNYTLTLNAVADFDGYFRKVNPMWERQLGWTAEEITSKPFIEFVHPDDRASTEKVARDVIEGVEVLNFENRYQCKDGTYRWLLWTSYGDKNQQLVYASAIDITERKRAESELVYSKKNLESIALKLQEQNQQLDEFAHIISHNLRSPVANIQSLISFINEKSSREDYELIFDKLKNVSKNLSETMNELMDTLRIKKSSHHDKVELRFKDVLDKVVQSLEGDLIKSGATVTFDFNAAPKINYSKTYLESIFQNLLSNAIKYSHPERKPAVHFETKVHNNRTELHVSDNGQGIDMEKHGDKLFGLHKTFHDHKEARGVGLFLTRTQIETLGGSISAISAAGKGTTFVIKF